MIVSEMPVAKTLYAKRLSDDKEFMVCSGFYYRETNIGGVNGVASDGEKAELQDGTFTLYRR